MCTTSCRYKKTKYVFFYFFEKLSRFFSVTNYLVKNFNGTIGIAVLDSTRKIGLKKQKSRNYFFSKNRHTQN